MARKLGSGGRPLGVMVPDRLLAAGIRTQILGLVAPPMALLLMLSVLLAGQSSAPWTRVLLIAGLVALGLAVPLLLALVLSRRVVRPLRRLRQSAEQITAELPNMVEALQRPGEDPDLTIEPVRVNGRDEVGRLAVAFNAVNRLTLQVAVEQAALRAGMAEMFVNAARRNQELLGRQLAFLDEMEVGEENPVTLRNLFQLDHLAAQMRRNDESLLVLAGVDSTRQLKAAMPLSDVLRTAIGEIEGFQRVELRLDVNPDVVGTRALEMAHLLAELIDNATQYSDPHTPVEVCTALDGERVIVSICDAGPGLGPRQLAKANDRLAGAPAPEAPVAQRLGFHVVARLAHRLDVFVEIRSRTEEGTVAVVIMPISLFVARSLPAAVRAPEKMAVSTAPATRPPSPTPQPTPAAQPSAAGEAVGETEPAPPVVEEAEPAPLVVQQTPAEPAAVMPSVPLRAKPRRRQRGGGQLPVHQGAVQPGPVPYAALQAPLAVQDILPGRELRRVTVLPATADVADVENPAAAPVAQPAIPQARGAAAGTRHPVAAPAPPSPAAALSATVAPALVAPDGSPPPPTAEPARPARGTDETTRSALAELSQLTSSPYTPSGAAAARPAPPAPQLTRRAPDPAEPESPSRQPALDAQRPAAEDAVQRDDGESS